MNEASRLLDGDLSAAELTVILERLKHDVDLRDEVSTEQLRRDALLGLRTPDDGYSLRILARLRELRAQGRQVQRSPPGGP
jgi:negative regulator of sigma E activity